MILAIPADYFVYRDEKNKAADRKFSAKAKRYAWISLATIGGGALIGITGGLVAPLIGAGLGQLLGASAIVATLTSGIGATLMIGSLFGVAGGGLTGKFTMPNWISYDYDNSTAP